MVGGNKPQVADFFFFPSLLPKLVLPKTNFFFLFSKLELIMAQQTSIHVNCFMAKGWHIWCHPVSKIQGEEPAETFLALKCLSYLISSLLTDIKCLAKN